MGVREFDFQKWIGFKKDYFIVTSYVGRDKAGKPKFEALCDCGNKFIARLNNLRYSTKSCGCYRKKVCKLNASPNKARKTCMEKYGVDSYSKTCDFKEKVANTCMEKYGIPHANTPEVIKKISESNKKTKSIWQLKKTGKTWDSDLEREKIDVNFMISRKLRNRLYQAIKNNYKLGSAVRDLGCSIEELKQHIESKFQESMSWENYGKWHIDHITPLASFNLENREELLKACHYTNLQPLWAEDNLSKGDKVVSA